MNRNIIVSGAGTGIGRAIAQQFARAGDHVVLLGRRAAVLETAAQQINETLGAHRNAVTWIPVDLSSVPDVEAMLRTLEEREMTTIDVIVNNAGGVVHTATHDLTDVAARWRQDFQTNVLTAVLLTEALLPRLRRPNGRIIHLSSIAAIQGGGDSYSGAKAALLGWTYHLAQVLGPQGITVNAIAPGYITDTEFFGESMTPERYQRLIARTLVGRAGTPTDVAAVAFFLASGQASYLTGQVIHVNGGAAFGR